ncbi:NAD-dependent DNA ligase LigA [Borrelia hermsii]|uniref:DNA ligase n=3 Tax=Borrelia hermsii TaxID=140 RepID=DNLJ_BORHD|nr:NAD-dependent DNA ligase LigA [Borrelia hermsii]B2S0Q2.1 RecName: Full=DNA ligase; AltName: Full=Polydeoxyribonucleotide synthase [NAD(+)] [Borrelia hermsii DAH]AAX17058.1 NAD-dependent DNA ligase [Borrelia hermsii DAH]AMR75298.1 NAD-dependent DNA ligase [Borrelia hermsii]ANA43356.1 DNA ligase (NAD(+)) LigA [Borrelia hermsii HS1]UPA07865.1 NAD-dependent DNA ligase LigA [Borrelia hermsii DAH]
MIEDVEDEILRLKNIIKRWNREYYVDSSPSVGDLTYDKALLRLQDLESKYPEYKTLDSPTFRFGSDLLNDFEEVKHSFPILSLDKTYDIKGLSLWIEKMVLESAISGLHTGISVEPKIDGCSIVLHYKDGILEKALTRGDGRVGNDVTENVKTIRNVPLRIDEKIELVLRGEIYITKENFLKINRTLKNPYVNARNLASGILRRISSKEVANFPLDIFVYDILYSSLKLNTSHDAFDKLKQFGFKVNPFCEFFGGKNLEAGIIAHVKKIEALRDSFEYEIDGVVLKIDSFILRKILGSTSHHPKWSIAYKFESCTGMSKVVDIVVQVGRSGKITPVAHVEKVLVAGASITNASLHNQDYIDFVGLNVGDIVVISRRGDVIPAVDLVIEKLAVGSFKIPSNCPSCKMTLIKEGAHLFCVNRHCSCRIIEQVKYFCSKKCMNIVGLSEKTIEFLFEKKFISSEVELYTFNCDRLINLKGFNLKRINNLKRSIEDSKSRPFRKLLLGMGIKDLGENTILVLINNNLNSFDTISTLCKNKEAALAKLLKIKGIGERIALNIIEAFNDKTILDKFNFFKELGLKMEEDNTNDAVYDSFLFGKKFCITGSFKGYSRDVLIEKLTKKGAVFSRSVTKCLDFLLVGEKFGLKVQKANNLGIKTFSLFDIKDFVDLDD